MQLVMQNMLQYGIDYVIIYISIFCLIYILVKWVRTFSTLSSALECIAFKLPHYIWRLHDSFAIKHIFRKATKRVLPKIGDEGSSSLTSAAKSSSDD